MSPTKNEMFPVFARIYKKSVLYIFLIISITLGLAAAFVEFIFGDFFPSILYLFTSIVWNVTVFLPFIRKLTGSKKLNKKNLDNQSITLNKHVALVERIISLLVIITAISMLFITLISGRHLYFIIEELWLIILGFSHFTFIFATRYYSKPQRR